jgi:hypothetical protein
MRPVRAQVPQCAGIRAAAFFERIRQHWQPVERQVRAGSLAGERIAPSTLTCFRMPHLLAIEVVAAPDTKWSDLFDFFWLMT